MTLKITSTKGREYSIDLTLAIKDKTWPEEAEEWKTRRRAGNITIDTSTYLMAILKEEFSFMNQSSRISKLFHTNYLSTAYTDCCLTLKMVEKNYLYRRTTVTKYNIKSFVEALNEILLAWKDSSSNMHWNHLNVKETLPSTEILSLRYAGQCFLVIGSQYYNKKCFVKDCIILAVCYFSVKFLTLAFFFLLMKRLAQ